MQEGYSWKLATFDAKRCQLSSVASFSHWDSSVHLICLQHVRCDAERRVNLSATVVVIVCDSLLLLTADPCICQISVEVIVWEIEWMSYSVNNVHFKRNSKFASTRWRRQNFGCTVWMYEPAIWEMLVFVPSLGKTGAGRSPNIKPAL